MSYSQDLREKVVEYVAKVGNKGEAAIVFGISLTTVYRWVEQKKKTGNLARKKLNRPFKKIDPDILRAKLKENPHAYLRELAAVFNCSTNCLSKACRRLGITRKKRPRSTVNGARKKEQIIRR